MKRLLLASLLAALTAAAQAQNTTADWASLGRYARQNDSVAALPAERRRVVFMGNSITDSWATMRPRFFADNGFVGRGISGQTTMQMVLRFAQDVIALRPQAVVINAGINDIAENTGPYDEQATFSNIRLMAEQARHYNINVVLTSVLPAAGFRWNRAVTDAPEKIESLNRRIRAYADKEGLTYIDYHAAMLAPDRRSLNPAYTRDGVHPTAAGYAVMEEFYKQTSH